VILKTGRGRWDAFGVDSRCANLLFLEIWTAHLFVSLFVAARVISIACFSEVIRAILTACPFVEISEAMTLEILLANPCVDWEILIAGLCVATDYVIGIARSIGRHREILVAGLCVATDYVI
jgi:hypothetical protein